MPCGFTILSDPLPHRILAGLVRGDDPGQLRQLIREQAYLRLICCKPLITGSVAWKVEWREEEEEYRVSDGQGKTCLRIPRPQCESQSR